jgi:hypothetical protein
MSAEEPNLDLLTPEQRWIVGWRNAAVALPKIREAELRALTDEIVFRQTGMGQSEDPHQNGLAILQRWLMRLHLLQKS